MISALVVNSGGFGELSAVIINIMNDRNLWVEGAAVEKLLGVCTTIFRGCQVGVLLEGFHQSFLVGVERHAGDLFDR